MKTPGCVNARLLRCGREIRQVPFQGFSNERLRCADLEACMLHANTVDDINPALPQGS